MALLLSDAVRADELAAWRDRAEQHYRAWLAVDAREVSTVRGGDLRVDVTGMVGWVPDLSVARLRIAHVVVTTARPPGGLFVGYVGMRGCRLGLWVAPAPVGLGGELVFTRAGQALEAIWRVAGTGHRILAHDMDEARFRAVADYLVHVSRKRTTDQPVRMAAKADVMTARCLG
jgi:hypothetical protein